jgi:hypothetical protein
MIMCCDTFLGYGNLTESDHIFVDNTFFLIKRSCAILSNITVQSFVRNLKTCQAVVTTPNANSTEPNNCCSYNQPLKLWSLTPGLDSAVKFRIEVFEVYFINLHRIGNLLCIPIGLLHLPLLEITATQLL